MSDKLTLAERAEAAGLTETEVSSFRDLEAERRMADGDEGKGEGEVAGTEAGAKADAGEGGEPAADKTDDKAAPDAGGEATTAEDRVLPVAPVLQVGSLEGIDDRLKAIRTELRTARQKLQLAEMTEDDFAQIEDRLEAEREGLVERRAQAKVQEQFNAANFEANFQTALRYFQRDVKKTDGIDYAGNKYLGVMFNAAYQDVVSKPEFKDRGLEAAEEAFQAAHEIVKAQIGKPAPAKTDPKPAEPKGADKAPAPKTLAGLPAAEPASTGDDIMDKINTLAGEDLEVFLAKLPKAKREELRRRAQ